ncbi:MAG: toprim domain-containing protein [bacterium]
MISDKIKAVGCNQTAFMKIVSNCENMVGQTAVKSNSIYSIESSPVEIWEQSQSTNKDHPYLKIKNIKSYGIRQYNNDLIIPMYDCNNKLQNLQRILPNGKKLFLPNKITNGCFYILEAVKPFSKIYIAEGYATAATIYEATEQCVVVAFSVSNLPAVAEIIKWEYPNEEIVICADNDAYSKSGENIGIDKATEAAAIIDAKLVTPKFKSTNTQPTDFNYLACLEGIEEVRKQLANAAKVDETQPSTDIKETSSEAIERLAKMELIEYGQVRKQEAVKLNVTVCFLDNAVKIYKQLNVASKKNKR